ncbi:MAG: DUF1566 domain-containing protein [Wenzhouxiangella sp.]|nr:DUF1566 domain-containing protein [Wenzhouxiangella sp.]MCH8479437.1 DUF1566 domain-containing protein [Wenzhouxiangella sp.]
MRIVPLLFVLLVALPLSAYSQINDTGQTQCFDEGQLAACSVANTGDGASHPRQDARFGRDAQAEAGLLDKVGGGVAGFDFTALDASGDDTEPGGHECVRDNVTGLVWSAETTRNRTWDQAISEASSLVRCGFSNWRVPTRRELISIVDHGANLPAIDTEFFPDTFSFLYWSNASYQPNSAFAWVVSFVSGGSDPISVENSPHVRFVRGSQLPIGPFTNNSDGTVTATSTGLMWDRCPWGREGSNCTDGDAAIHNWATALGIALVANDTNHLGYDDWRLPSRSELESLINLARNNPAISPLAFPNTPGADFWSSTVRTANPIQSWTVNFLGGATNFSLRSDELHLRLVRGGQSFDGFVAFKVGGTLSGLAEGNSVTLQINGNDDLILSENGNFVFPTSVQDMNPYEVSVFNQPDGQYCSVENAGGTIAGEDVKDVAVECASIDLSLSQNEVQFTSLNPGQRAEQMVMLTNTGQPDLVIEQFLAPEEPFGVDPMDCLALPRTLGSGESCSVILSFESMAIGAIEDELWIVSNSSTSPDRIGLSGSVLPGIPIPTLGWAAVALLILIMLLAGIRFARLS